MPTAPAATGASGSFPDGAARRAIYLRRRREEEPFFAAVFLRADFLRPPRFEVFFEAAFLPEDFLAPRDVAFFLLAPEARFRAVFLAPDLLPRDWPVRLRLSVPAVVLALTSLLKLLRSPEAVSS